VIRSTGTHSPSQACIDFPHKRRLRPIDVRDVVRCASFLN
jgi:hypothetical protein